MADIAELEKKIILLESKATTAEERKAELLKRMRETIEPGSSLSIEDVDAWLLEETANLQQRQEALDQQIQLLEAKVNAASPSIGADK